jgi:hypothetical protein
MALMSEAALSKIGPNTARAWMDTTITEAINILDAERVHIVKGEVGWRFRPPRSEFFGPLGRRLSEVSERNLQQIFGYLPELKDSVEKHDDGIVELVTSCKALETAILDSREFNETVERMKNKAEKELGQPWQSFFGAYSDPQDHLLLLAGHIINRTRFKLPIIGPEHLAEHYTIAPLWNKYREELVQVRMVGSVQVHVQSVAKSCAALENEVELLRSSFMQLRTALGEKHDLPFAAPLSH